MARLLVIFRFALRNKARFFATALSVAVTLVAFLILRVVVTKYAVKEEGTRADRLVVRHKNSIFFPLYTAQARKAAQLPGVQSVSWMCWFAGIYIDELHRFPQLAVEGESYFEMYPEFRPSEAEFKEWMADPTGAIAGDALVKRHGWKIGDRIALKGTIYPGDWNLTLRGIYHGATPDTDRERLYMHWKYLNETLPGGDHVQRILVQVKNPSVGRDIDAYFANSATPTKAESELTVQRQWASWSAGVVQSLSAASVVVLLVLGLVLGNSMALAARESTREYAVMRAIGFRPRQITVLVLGQALLAVCVGAVLAVVTVPSVLKAMSTLLAAQLGGSWQLQLNWLALLMATAAGLVLGLLASALPAWRSSRINIVDGLRRVT